MLDAAVTGNNSLRKAAKKLSELNVEIKTVESRGGFDVKLSSLNPVVNVDKFTAELIKNNLEAFIKRTIENLENLARLRIKQAITPQASEPVALVEGPPPAVKVEGGDQVDLGAVEEEAGLPDMTIDSLEGEDTVA